MSSQGRALYVLDRLGLKYGSCYRVTEDFNNRDMDLQQTWTFNKHGPSANRLFVRRTAAVEVRDKYLMNATVLTSRTRHISYVAPGVNDERKLLRRCPYIQLGGIIPAPRSHLRSQTLQAYNPAWGCGTTSSPDAEVSTCATNFWIYVSSVQQQKIPWRLMATSSSSQFLERNTASPRCL